MLALERNVGFAAATNAGIAASRGRLLALVNSDAFPDEGSIDRLADAIDALPRAAIVGGRLRYPDGAPQPSTGRFPSLLGGLWTALLLHRMPLLGRLDVGVNAHPAHYRVRRRVDWVTAAFCIARRESGPLPERSFMYGEDVEWARESASAGREVWFDPGASGRAPAARRASRAAATRGSRSASARASSSNGSGGAGGLRCWARGLCSRSHASRARFALSACARRRLRRREPRARRPARADYAAVARISAVSRSSSALGRRGPRARRVGDPLRCSDASDPARPCNASCAILL